MTMLKADIKAAIEGVYLLDEWHCRGTVCRPPHVKGRYVLLGGITILILVDTLEMDQHGFVSKHGSYSVSETSFTYGWEDQLRVIQSCAKIERINGETLQGRRIFTVETKGDDVRFISETSENAEFLFTQRSRMIYSEAGKKLRVWRRQEDGGAFSSVG